MIGNNSPRNYLEEQIPLNTQSNIYHAKAAVTEVLATCICVSGFMATMFSILATTYQKMPANATLYDAALRSVSTDFSSSSDIHIPLAIMSCTAVNVLICFTAQVIYTAKANLT